METGLMTWLMAEERAAARMVRSILGSGSATNNMGVGVKSGVMERGLKDSTAKAPRQALVLFTGQMVPASKASFSTMTSTASASTFGAMGAGMRENGAGTRCMGRAPTLGQMAELMMV